MKSRRQSVSQAGNGSLGFVPINAPTPPTFTTDSPAKKPPFQTFPHSSMPQSALFTTFSSINPDRNPEKENVPVNESHNDGFADFPEPSYGSKPPLKRALMDAAPLKERPAKKHKRGDSASTHLPEPHELPPIEDDGTKPPYSYATLIGMSILRAPNRRLTLAQIYKWISDTFKYYRKCDPGWQNSIRHNLSLNKAFVKQERPKDDPGKGNYWAIEPGMEAQFLKDKSFRRPTMSSLPLPAAPQGHPVHHLQHSGASTWVVPPPPASSTAPKPARPVDLSSDATLPASDPALQEDAGEENAHAAPSQPAQPQSSPPQPIHSSPPVAPPRLTRHGTPPTPSHIPPSSTAGERPGKRKATAMNDSGYFSSLDSSAMRPNKAARIMTSDLDVEPPRIKRGRAEEEIARIRSSSHDISPNHGGERKSSTVAVGSSPLRGEHVSMLPPPLTPVFKFKKPAKPPASVSPNTNLRNHRKKIQQMVNSPIKHLGLTDEDLPWSPAFKIQDELLTPNDNFHANFDVFGDVVENTSTPAYGSPAKLSAKRGRPEAGGNVLADITSMSVNNRMGMSSNKSKGLLFPESPSKVPDSGRFVDASNDEFFSFNLFDESPGEVDGVDLLQGFQKIGDDSSRGRHALRPTLNPRSNTSLF
jgi:forkhead transcription factor HCM1